MGNEELADRAKKVTGFICGTLKLGNTFSKELVFDICTRLDVNSFEVPLGRSSATVQGIFTIACMVEHSCIPTGHRCFNSDMSITVRSAYGAEEGDAVSICYTDSLWPTAARREHLVYSKDFLCVCDRCQDETENETYISGIRCTKCPAGYFLPENPIDCAARWICNECGMEAPKGYQDIVNEKVASAIAKLEEAGLTPEACEKFLKTYGKVLHPNHAHMLDIKYSYLNILGHSEGCTMSQMTDVQLQTKENLARNFLEIARKILPGISRLKGTALYELYLSIQQRALRAFFAQDVVGHCAAQLAPTATTTRLSATTSSSQGAGSMRLTRTPCTTWSPSSDASTSATRTRRPGRTCSLCRGPTRRS